MPILQAFAVIDPSNSHPFYHRLGRRIRAWST